MRMANVCGLGVLAVCISVPVAHSDPGSYPVIASHGLGVWALITLVIVAIETPIVALLAGWAWQWALLGALLANVFSTFCGAFFRPQTTPDIPALLAIAIVAEGAFLVAFAIRRRDTVTPIVAGRFLSAIVLMNLATVWVSPALQPVPSKGEKYRQVLCQRQLHGIALALSVYSEEHDARWPEVSSAEGLRDALSDYLPAVYAGEPSRLTGRAAWQNAFHCPETFGRWTLASPRGSSTNYQLFVSDMRTLDVSDYPVKVLLADDRPRHQGWRNCLFVDGHCSSMREKAFQDHLRQQPTEGLARATDDH